METETESETVSNGHDLGTDVKVKFRKKRVAKPKPEVKVETYKLSEQSRSFILGLLENMTVEAMNPEAAKILFHVQELKNELKIK